MELLPEVYEIKGREQQEAGTMLLGRSSYQAFAPVWPTMEEFAEYNAMPRYVVSTNLEEQDPGWPATILRNICRFGVVGTASPRSWYRCSTYPVLQGVFFHS